MDVESVRSIGLRQVVGVLERALDPSVSLEVLEEAMRRLTELDASGRAAGAALVVGSPAPGSCAAEKHEALPPVEGMA
jgi:hypothetical protein